MASLKASSITINLIGCLRWSQHFGPKSDISPMVDSEVTIMSTFCPFTISFEMNVSITYVTCMLGKNQTMLTPCFDGY